MRSNRHTATGHGSDRVDRSVEEAAPTLIEQRLDPSSIDGSQHFNVLREMMAHRCDVEPLRSDWRFTTFRCWRWGSLLVTHHACGPSRYERTRALAQSPQNQFLGVRLVRAGRLLLQTDGRHFVEAGPGDVLLMDWTLPSVCTTTDYDVYSFNIPRDQVPATALMGRKLPALTLRRDQADGALLGSVMRAFIARLPTLDADSARAPVAGFVQLIDGLLGSHPALLRAQYANASRLAAMKSRLADSLRDGEAGAGQLCREFGCSRATVYRLFEADGGVAAYLQRQRLQQCLAELVRGNWATYAPLASLAEAYQLGGPVRFRRLFRSEFHVSPEQVVAANTQHQPPRATRYPRAVADVRRVLEADDPAPLRGCAGPVSRRTLP